MFETVSNYWTSCLRDHFLFWTGRFTLHLLPDAPVLLYFLSAQTGCLVLRVSRNTSYIHHPDLHVRCFLDKYWFCASFAFKSLINYYEISCLLISMAVCKKLMFCNVNLFCDIKFWKFVSKRNKRIYFHVKAKMILWQCLSVCLRVCLSVCLPAWMNKRTLVGC